MVGCHLIERKFHPLSMLLATISVLAAGAVSSQELYAVAHLLGIMHYEYVFWFLSLLLTGSPGSALTHQTVISGTPFLMKL